jgi:ribosomal protein S18 acetylase RimI-like enzyme
MTTQSSRNRSSLHFISASEADRDAVWQDFLDWLIPASSPYPEALFGGVEPAREMLDQWARRVDSEYAFDAADLLMVGDRSSGGLICFDGRELARRRRADMMQLLTNPKLRHLRSRLPDLQGLLAPVAPDDFYLSRVGLIPEARGKGLGHRLLQHFTDCARQGGYRRLRLDVHAGNNAARRLYESAGYRVIYAGHAPKAGLTYFSMIRDLPEQSD